MESNPNMASLRYGGLSLVLALATAVVTANPFADAAGFPAIPPRGPEPEHVLPRILCGIVLFFLFWMLFRFLFQVGTRIVWQLGQVRERPGLPVAITLLACGTLCVLAALLVAWYGSGVSASPQVSLPNNMPGGNMLPTIDISVRTTGSLTRPLAVFTALVIGAALLALGVWSSLVPAPANVASKEPTQEGGAA